jgi:thiamine kinase-like enzyme
MGPLITIDAADWDHPNVAAWPGQARRRLAQLWTDRDSLVAITESAERTLCHLDVWPANLVDDAGTSVLLDWSFTGDGAVGEDVANLIVDSFTDGLMDVALLPELAERATDGYIHGLRDGGWSGSADSVRTAIAACGAAKYSWFAPAYITRAIRDELSPASYGQDTSAAEAVSRLTGLITLLAEWADQAGIGRG